MKIARAEISLTDRLTPGATSKAWFKATR